MKSYLFLPFLMISCAPINKEADSSSTIDLSEGNAHGIDAAPATESCKCDYTPEEPIELIFFEKLLKGDSYHVTFNVKGSKHKDIQTFQTYIHPTCIEQIEKQKTFRATLQRKISGEACKPIDIVPIDYDPMRCEVN